MENENNGDNDEMADIDKDDSNDDSSSSSSSSDEFESSGNILNFNGILVFNSEFDSFYLQL